jgi:hypothetical protein
MAAKPIRKNETAAVLATYVAREFLYMPAWCIYERSAITPPTMAMSCTSSNRRQRDPGHRQNAHLR